jgi:hypothetical protein
MFAKHGLLREVIKAEGSLLEAIEDVIFLLVVFLLVVFLLVRTLISVSGACGELDLRRPPSFLLICLFPSSGKLLSSRLAKAATLIKQSFFA